MISRKNFLITGFSSITTLTITGKALGGKVKTISTLNKTNPATGLVVWYSQTGNTERVARAIAETLKTAGLKVDSGDYREIDRAKLDKYDIIAIGSPVYYYEIPSNFREWLENMPRIEGTPVASFVTFGGEGGNQHNAVCELAELLAEKGGVPLGISGYSCMLSWCLTWPFTSKSHLLKYIDRPNADTFEAAANFAGEILVKAIKGEVPDLSKEFDLRNIIKGKPSIGFTKLLITGHRVNTGKCINCGSCVRACPVDAIVPAAGTVDREKCIACLGCINNCPANAVEIQFAGKEIYGYKEFIKRNNIKIEEPVI